MGEMSRQDTREDAIENVNNSFQKQFHTMVLSPYGNKKEICPFFSMSCERLDGSGNTGQMV